RRLSQFASFVAHELRNPLAVARARIELSQREAHNPERAATHGSRALESVEAAIAVLERLEMYSRADSGTVEAINEPFDPRRGLGLFLTNAMMEAQDGSVLLEQRQPTAAFALRWQPAPAQRAGKDAQSNDVDQADGADADGGGAPASNAGGRATSEDRAGVRV